MANVSMSPKATTARRSSPCGSGVCQRHWHLGPVTPFGSQATVTMSAPPPLRSSMPPVVMSMPPLSTPMSVQMAVACCPGITSVSVSQLPTISPASEPSTCRSSEPCVLAGSLSATAIGRFARPPDDV